MPKRVPQEILTFARTLRNQQTNAESVLEHIYRLLQERSESPSPLPLSQREKES